MAFFLWVLDGYHKEAEFVTFVWSSGPSITQALFWACRMWWKHDAEKGRKIGAETNQAHRHARGFCIKAR
jgi:hypothetical protein